MAAMRTRRLWPVLALAPIGMITGHQLVYALSHGAHREGPPGSHGHLGALAGLGLLLAAAAGGALLRRRGRGEAMPSVAVLAASQVTAFAVMETAERLVVGGDLGELARSPLLWGGLAIQTVVAVAVLAGIRAARTTVAALLQRPMMAGVRLLPAPVPVPPRLPQPPSLEATGWLLQRGPPPPLLGP